MNRADVIAKLDGSKDEIAKFDVADLCLFGSFVRDQAREDSDIDLLVNFLSPPTFNRYMGLKFFLEDLLSRKVDLVIEGTLRKELRPRVMKEAIRVA
jgi:uncharacterized protein